MSDVHQLGHHPDADRISAFVEQALPAHEREQMFAHLAVCAECREVVALSLPSIDERQSVKPLAAARRPWWSGWNLALPAAAVLAGLSAFVLYIHNSANAPNVSPRSQIAGVRESAAPVAAARPSSEAAKAAPRGTAAEKPANNIARSESKARGAAEQPPAASEPVGGMGAIPMQGRNPGQLGAPAEAPFALKSAPNMRLGAASGAGAAGGLGIGTATGTGANPTLGAQAALKKAAPADAAARALAPAPATNPPPGRSSQTVSVSADAHEMETVSSLAAGAPISLDALQTTPFIPLKHSLPSRRAVLSLASQGRRMVAIDLDNGVYVSKDAGKHWKPVAAPWPGRAVRAGLVSFTPASRAAFSMAKGAAIGGPLRATAPASIDGPVAAHGARLDGSVTDATGAAIAGATVEVTDSATNTARIVTTDGAGHYLVDALKPGSYRVEARARGFETRVLPAVAVTAGRSTVADLSLTVGSASETVTVEAESTNLTEANADRKAAKKIQPTQIFEITTDTGERWTSADGVTWHRN